MVGMSDLDNDGFSIECGTCVATGTTACTDCVVSHLLANDDGPIDFVTVAPPATAADRAIALFAQAGMLDDPVRFVGLDEFERGIVSDLAVVP